MRSRKKEEGQWGVGDDFAHELELNGRWVAFHSALLAVKVVAVQDDGGTDHCYTVNIYKYADAETESVELLTLTQALHVAGVMSRIYEQLDSTAREATNLMLVGDDVSCDECGEPVVDARCSDCSGRWECAECDNEASWCLPCATRVIHTLDGATFTEERPSVPVERQ